ncbi:DUF917 domain-containing protein [Pseudonocardia acaciae]|uniref:DUF917 domain-containing protein n=1 Tax=Pseudonocardia acaciae TaxID=551276 RepID=UPI00048D7D7C|nr:DUF917 domain-containing protein [Pseudonocardia acaciae]
MSTSYLGGGAAIAAEDVPALYAGANFYTPAIADLGWTSLLAWTVSLLERNGPVPLVRPTAIAPDTRCAAVCVIGSGAAMADLPPTGDEFAMAVRELAAMTGASDFDAVYPLAAATVSAVVPVAVASQLGVPLLDADGEGRTFALIHHTAMHLAGVAATPLVVRGVTGESVGIRVLASARVDTLLRSNVEVLGGWAALAGYPSTAGELCRAALPGTVSRLLNVGRLLRESTGADELVARLAAVTGCRRLGRGRIVELEHLSRPTDLMNPAHPSTVVIDEVGGGGGGGGGKCDSGRMYRLELRSEIVAVFADGALVAAAPDLISLVNVQYGEVATLDNLEPGDLVDILVMPADAVWYSAEGLAMVGPASHGIPLDHPRRR